MKTGEEILDTLQHGVEIQKRLNQKWFSEEEFNEALDVIADVLNQACQIELSGDGSVPKLDSMAMNSYADAMRFLEKHNRFTIISEYGHRVIGYLTSE